MDSVNVLQWICLGSFYLVLVFISVSLKSATSPESHLHYPTPHFQQQLVMSLTSLFSHWRLHDPIHKSEF